MYSFTVLPVQTTSAFVLVTAGKGDSTTSSSTSSVTPSQAVQTTSSGAAGREGKDGGTPLGAIIGGAAGGVALLVFAGIIAWICLKKRRKSRAKEQIQNRVEKEESRSQYIKAELDASEAPKERLTERKQEDAVSSKRISGIDDLHELEAPERLRDAL